MPWTRDCLIGMLGFYNQQDLLLEYMSDYIDQHQMFGIP